MTDPLALAGPWRALAADLPLPWAMELDVDGVRLLVTNDDRTGRAWRGPALHADEWALVCAAAEVDRMTAQGLRVLLRGLARTRRPLTWAVVAGIEQGPPSLRAALADRGGLSLGWTLGRLGAELVRLDVVERPAVVERGGAQERPGLARMAEGSGAGAAGRVRAPGGAGRGM